MIWKHAAIANNGTVASMTVGLNHACMLDAVGRLKCWGSTLPAGVEDPNGVWETAEAAIAGATDISVGGSTSCALDGQGALYCWGSNQHGQLGDGTTHHKSMPTRIASVGDAVDVAVGSNFVCALQPNGQPFCWGANESGQLGLGDTDDRHTPEPVPLMGASTIYAGANHACALVQGAAWCWGSNDHGQLGIGGGGTVVLPQRVDALTSFKSLSLGTHHTCAVDELDDVWCWGSNRDGQVSGVLFDETAPEPYRTGISAQTVVAGGDASCVPAGNSITCWGDAFNVGATPASVRALSVNSTLVCAVGDSTEMRCWDVDGQVSVSTMPAPAERLVSAGHICALSTSGDVRCVGNGFGGALGNGLGFIAEPVPLVLQ